jgi:hypothetical protein
MTVVEWYLNVCLQIFLGKECALEKAVAKILIRVFIGELSCKPSFDIKAGAQKYSAPFRLSRPMYENMQQDVLFFDVKDNI